MSKTTAAKASRATKEIDVSNLAIISDTRGITLLKDSYLDVLMKLPLPGIVIFVHGVNSDGEWYDQAEEGLCQGLNERLKRKDEQMAFPCPEGGQLKQAGYKAELTPDGYVHPDRQADNFIENESHFSPVIRFRWGYKASSDELQAHGSGIYLNEHNYWGGGPFANGCTSLPDLWNEGISQNMLLWWEIAHFNPLSDRPVFSCPPRPYFVLAALRLAKLIESIRRLQANTPVTIVCHSQGNMVTIAAAFLGDRMPDVIGEDGVAGRCVADTYVLCNPPYSLQTSKFIENWSDTHMKDQDGGSGRQTAEARIQTLKNFFDILRRPGSSSPQEVEEINKAMENKRHQFDAGSDRELHGYGTPKRTCGRVTLYCNPHDQVISATTIRGIGWLGMSAAEIDVTNGHGVFSQRVFAQGFEVGNQATEYRYWQDHHRGVKDGSNDFWMPRSPTVTYTLTSYTTNGYAGKVISFVTAPLMYIVTAISGTRVNAVPPKKWSIPLQAPVLPEPFKPLGPTRDGRETAFDQGREAPGEDREANRVRDDKDPYAGDRPLQQRTGEPARPATDAGRGTVHTEAQLRYEHHGRLRMEARQEGFAKKEAKHVTAEDDLSTASDEYKAWREKKIGQYLSQCTDNNATDHSTIMTNPEHARLALAYDVAVGVCGIAPLDLNNLRKAADWRLLNGLPDKSTHVDFIEYIEHGTFAEASLKKWVEQPGSDGSIPVQVVDKREYSPQKIAKYRI